MICFGRRREADTSFSFRRLGEADELSAISDINELNSLFVLFGRALLNVSPEDISRLKAAVENDNSEEISQIIGRADRNSTTRNNETELRSIDVLHDTFFRMAVKDCKTRWVEFFLNKIADKSIPFGASAPMMKESFNELWLDYRSFLEDMMKKDVLGWDVCTIEVPIETFTVDSNLGTRVGTCNTILDWIHASQQGAASEHWRSLNTKGVDKVMKNSRGRKVNAIVRMYCFEDACQIGLGGIVRFLLMHNAPSYLFKTPLIKWVITYKWEKTWKVIAFKRLASFLVLFIGFHIFAFVVTYQDYSFVPSESAVPLSFFSVIVLILLPILTLRREFFQLKRCILDGRRVFPNKYFRGIGIYFGSRQNQIDLMLSGVIVLFFALNALYTTGIMYVEIGIAFFAGLTLELLLMWAKVFYMSQAFKRTGIFVLMIGRVLRECAPYFLLLLGITIGFGLAMRVAFFKFRKEEVVFEDWERDSWWPQPSPSPSGIDIADVEKVFDEEDDDRARLSFGSLYVSILTMAYAMVGLFDPEVLFNCGPLRGLMITLFMLYLFLQTIVMFNMLIASMGDAYDGVRAAEEELFLMARAMFIDQYEASLSNKAIRKMKRKIGRYLYVLMPEDKQLEENVLFWKGRIPTIKEDVRKIVADSQNQMSQSTSEMFRTLMDEIKGLKEQVMTLEQRISEKSRSDTVC